MASPALSIDPSVIKEVPAKYAAHYHCVPIGREEGILVIAMSREPDLEMHDEIRVVLRQEIRILPALEEDIQKAMKEHYGIGADTLERLADAAEEAPKVPEVSGTDLDA